MSLVDIPLDQISESDLQRLIATPASESVYIDYKEITYGPSGDQHREFLADISSFANTVGGDLIIGMTEANGIPTGFKPFPDYPDAELRRLDDMARTGLQPRISNLRTRAVPAPGGYVIVVRIPRSYSQPHRVIHSNSNRFWARSSASPKRYEPNVEELRRIFNDAPLIANRIRAFRTDRLVKIAAQEAPITLAGNCLLALHVVPYRSVGIGTALSVAELESDWHRFPPLGRPYGHAVLKPRLRRGLRAKLGRRQANGGVAPRCRGVVRVPRRVFQRLLPERPTPELCIEAYYLQRTRFESVAERKLRRRQLGEDGNVEISGRDLRQVSDEARGDGRVSASNRPFPDIRAGT